LYKGERADARSDIWAVGVSLYELLAFKRPFTGESEAELMFHIIYEKPEDLQSQSPECTEELALIVGKMLEKKSEDRYQSMDDLLHAIEPIWKAAQQATVSGLLADCQELVVAKDLQRAHALLRKALHIDVGNSQAKSMLEKVSVELRRSEIQPRLQEHLSRGEGYLKAGQLREAKAEAQAALGLDSKHEPAHKLLTEVDAAAAKAQQLEQKLKLTKQRLAEGALTEAAAALGQAVELDDANLQVHELKKQIEEERVRREKRKKLGEILHRARTLWTELNYGECLTVLAAALQEFPNDPDLKKLQESAKTDQAELQKQRQMAEVRRLLGQQNFAEARKILDVLATDHPQDTAVKNLQNLALQEEQEQKRQKRLESEITLLRGLLGAGKVKQVVAKGEPLLEEFPQEYELKELVNYARGEAAQQEQKRKEEEREKQIQGFLMCERYGEALDTARLAIEEFPRQDAFRKLATEAEALKREQDDRERARNEMQRRVREINSKINQDKITDAIDLAQQTMESMGPDPNVTQLLQGAEEKRKKKDEAEKKVTAVQALVNKGDHAGATQMFNEVMATQIFEASDPRMQELKGKITNLASGQVPAATQLYSAAKTTVQKTPSSAKREKPAAAKPAPPTGDLTQVSESAQNIAAAGFSATKVIGGGEKPGSRKDGTVPRRPDSSGKDTAARKTEVPDATVMVGPTTVRLPAAAIGVPAEPRQSGSVTASAAVPIVPAKPKPGGDALGKVLPILTRPPVLAGVGLVVVLLLAVALWPHKTNGGTPSAADLKLKQQAGELWQNRQFDRSEQVWQGLAKNKGPLQNEAAQQVSQIEQKRADEQKRFDDAEALLKDKKDYAGAQLAFQDVIQMNLWHFNDATAELETAKAGLSATDVHKQEQDHFDLGVTLYQAKDFEKSRKEFRAVVDLNIPGSTLKPQAESYLGKIRQTGNDQKTYDAAIQEMKDESWAEAKDQFLEVINRKGAQSADAKKQLPVVEKALQTVSTVEESIHAGSFRAAKAQVDSAQQWNKTHEKLLKDLHGAEQQQFDQIKSNAQAAESKSDPAAIQRVQDDLHSFEGRAEEPLLLTASQDLEKRMNAAYSTAVGKTGDKAAFDAAVQHFEQAKLKKDTDLLAHGVMQEFQKIAAGTGIYRENASMYVKTTIPNEIQALTQTSGKVLLQAISCGPGRGGQEAASVAGSVTCAQLDANPPLQWVGIPMVDFPDVANKPGKLPYSLTVVVSVDSNGNVKIDKEGDADKDFLKKVKDASKHWKTTAPRAAGKPVSVRFPFTITFQR
jgi:hypothetical protein